MRAINYRDLLADSEVPAPVQAARQRSATIVEVYRDGNGYQYRSQAGSRPYFHEIVRLGEEALLLSTDTYADSGGVGWQVVDGSDWIHIQFRFDGDGYEVFPD